MRSLTPLERRVSKLEKANQAAIRRKEGEWFNWLANWELFWLREIADEFGDAELETKLPTFRSRAEQRQHGGIPSELWNAVKTRMYIKPEPEPPWSLSAEIEQIRGIVREEWEFRKGMRLDLDALDLDGLCIIEMLRATPNLQSRGSWNGCNAPLEQVLRTLSQITFPAKAESKQGESVLETIDRPLLLEDLDLTVAGYRSR